MEKIIKKAIEVGTSAGVLVPRKWLNKSVLVQLIPQDDKAITKSAIDILIEKGVFQDSIGIYLTGSYARGEQEPGSDIDLLVITNNTDMLIKEEPYEIICISKKSLEREIKKSIYIISLVREAKSLFNKLGIDMYKKQTEISSFELGAVLKEIRKMLDFNKIVIENEKRVSSGTVYSIVLRTRELYLIDCLLNGKNPTKKQFMNLLGNERLYKIYENVKNDKKKEEYAPVGEVEEIIKKAYGLLLKWEKQKA
jgi:predicted nucleotidyltransferase